MRVDGNYGSLLGYRSYSYGEWTEQPDCAKPPLNLEGDADDCNHRMNEDYHSKPGKLFRLMGSAK